MLSESGCEASRELRPPPADAPTKPVSAVPAPEPPPPGQRERPRECSSQRLVRQRAQWWRTVLRTSVLRKQKNSVTTKPCINTNRLMFPFRKTFDYFSHYFSALLLLGCLSNGKLRASEKKLEQSIRDALLTRRISTRGIAAVERRGNSENHAGGARFLRDIKVGARGSMSQPLQADCVYILIIRRAGGRRKENWPPLRRAHARLTAS